MEEELLLRNEVYQVVGAGIEVHRDLGAGFAEAVYQEAMELELGFRGIPFLAQMPLKIYYKGRELNKSYCADFVCFGQLLVEIKAQDRLYPRDESQLLNYLKATGLKVGLLLNFGYYGRLERKRMVRTKYGALNLDDPSLE